MKIGTMFTISVVLPLIGGTNTETKINYTWLEHNDKYDAIVGISVNNRPICSGVLVNKYSVITSANPIYIHVQYYHLESADLYVHAINGAYDKSIVHLVQYVTYQSRRGSYFKPFGFDGRHSPIHDIAIISLLEPMETFTEIVFLSRPGQWGDTTTTKIVRFPPYSGRYYTMKPIINVMMFEPNGWFSIVGHGFIDKLHVKQNIDLEVIDYEVHAVLQDCDEWIPRGWGHFICLLNIERFVGITAGGALFYNRRFIGIGSFSVMKGNETILIFTDLRKYHGMKDYKGYVEILSDNLSADFNPDDVTPRANWWYLTNLASAEGAEVTPGHPVTKMPMGYWFYS